MNKTPNYSLNQWEADDKVQRVDFNADNARIDAALAGKAEAAALTALSARTPAVFTGTYTGDGTDGRIIELGFRPKAVLTVQRGWMFCHSGSVATVPKGGLAIDQELDKSSNSYLSVTDTGFRVTSIGTNEKNEPYIYLVIA